jgi:hypothetical protein
MKSPYKKRPLTVAEVNAMDSKEFHWHSLNNLDELNKVITPPPPPAPETEQEKEQRLRAESAALKKQLDTEFADFLKCRGVKGVHTSQHIQEFWAEKAEIKRGWPTFLVDHPRYDSESNRKKLMKWVETYDLPATAQNLNKAFAAIKKNLELKPVEIPPDPNALEMRPGVWKNGRFIPDPNYVAGVEVSYAQHSAPLLHVGQVDPSKAASPEVTPRKSVKQMTAAEYLSWLNASRSFQKQMDASES